MNNRLQELENRKLELIQTIRTCEEEIEYANLKGIPDINAYHSENNRLLFSQNELLSVEQEIINVQNQTQELEDTSAEVQSTIDADLEDIDGVNMFELLCSLADPNQEQDPKAAYDFIVGYIKEKAVNIATTQTIITQSYKSEIESLQASVSEISKLRAELEAWERENATKDNELVLLSNQVEDLDSKRAAASLEIDELKQDNERLKEDNTSLRKRIEELSSNNSGYMKTSGLAAQLIKEPKPIYNLEWEDDLKKTRYRAILATTGEVIFIPHYAINSYKVLEGEELARFQEEQQSNEAEQVAQPIHEEVELQTPTLQNAYIYTGERISTGGEVVHETENVTRAEFEEVKRQLGEVRNRLGL